MMDLPLGVFSRTEQRVLHVIFKAIVDSDGYCVASLATLANASNTSRGTTRNAIARAVGVGLLKETEQGLACRAVPTERRKCPQIPSSGRRGHLRHCEPETADSHRAAGVRL
jgi:hypothetical protein